MRSPDQVMYRCSRGSVSAGGNRASDGLASIARAPSVQGERPRLRVRVVGGLAVVEIMNAGFLFDHGVIQEIGRQLHRLVKQGHIRLLVNLGGIESMSCEVLATLAGLYREVHRQDGRLGLYGLQPQFRDMIRICHLDRILDIYADESEALSRNTQDWRDGLASRGQGGGLDGLSGDGCSATRLSGGQTSRDGLVVRSGEELA